MPKIAGYCWDWKSEGKNDPSHLDIYLSDFEFGMSWNLANTATWAIDEDSVSEAGCIHTCQGLEFDYVGVIIGEDMVFQDGQVLTNYKKRARTDQYLKGIAKMMKEDPEKAAKLADDGVEGTLGDIA